MSWKYYGTVGIEWAKTYARYAQPGHGLTAKFGMTLARLELL